MLLPFLSPKGDKLVLRQKFRFFPLQVASLHLSEFILGFLLTSSTSKHLWYFSGELTTSVLFLRKEFLTDEGFDCQF